MLFASQFASFQGSLSRFCVGGKCILWDREMQFRSPVAAATTFLLPKPKNADIFLTSHVGSVLFRDAVSAHKPTTRGPSKVLQFRQRSSVHQVVFPFQCTPRFFEVFAASLLFS